MKLPLQLLGAGRWSGGGAAVLDNLYFFAERYPSILTTRGDAGGPCFVPRNVVPLGVLAGGDYVVMPQNLWAWRGGTRGWAEWWWRSRMRIASEAALHRAGGVVRLCSDIPCDGFGHQPPLPNVLDASFERAFRRSTHWAEVQGGFTYFGTSYSYRNLSRLIEGYGEYRRLGGSRNLHLFISHPTNASRLPRPLPAGCRVRLGSWTRSDVISATRSGHAAVFPSTVEASPIGLLEALAVSARVVLSDIRGHRETCRDLISDDCYFAPAVVVSIARALIRSETSLPTAAPFQQTTEAREGARDQWAHGLHGRLVMMCC